MAYIEIDFKDCVLDKSLLDEESYITCENCGSKKNLLYVIDGKEDRILCETCTLLEIKIREDGNNIIGEI